MPKSISNMSDWELIDSLLKIISNLDDDTLVALFDCGSAYLRREELTPIMRHYLNIHASKYLGVEDNVVNFEMAKLRLRG